MPALTMALTMLHAGGKFGGGGYKVSGGLHGVGVSVVNALSSRLIAEVRNRGHLWRQSFTIGVPDGDLEQVRPMEPGERTGTTVTWYASEDIFESTHYNLETITSRLREMAFLNKGVEFVVRDERADAESRVDAVQDDTIDNEVDNAGHDAIKRAEGGGLEQVFKYDRGLVDPVVHDLPDQVVQAALAGRADVHAGALAHRLEALEDRDRGRVVLEVLVDRVGRALGGDGLAGGVGGSG
jgi:DNA gyrase subunit B